MSVQYAFSAMSRQKKKQVANRSPPTIKLAQKNISSTEMVDALNIL
jgi:hypothetical protein